MKRKNNVKIGLLVRQKNNTFSGNNRIGNGSHVVDCMLGRHTYISSQCSILHARIGSFCSIANRVPRIYRNKFGRDVYKDLMTLNDAIKDQTEDASTLDGFSLEMFEDLAFVMWSAAHPEEKYDSPDEWLDQFNTFSIYQILPELIDLWGMNIRTTVPAGKN